MDKTVDKGAVLGGKAQKAQQTKKIRDHQRAEKKLKAQKNGEYFSMNEVYEYHSWDELSKENQQTISYLIKDDISLNISILIDKIVPSIRRRLKNNGKLEEGITEVYVEFFREQVNENNKKILILSVGLYVWKGHGNDINLKVSHVWYANKFITYISEAFITNRKSPLNVKEYIVAANRNSELTRKNIKPRYHDYWDLREDTFRTNSLDRLVEETIDIFSFELNRSYYQNGVIITELNGGDRLEQTLFGEVENTEYKVREAWLDKVVSFNEYQNMPETKIAERTYLIMSQMIILNDDFVEYINNNYLIDENRSELLYNFTDENRFNLTFYDEDDDVSFEEHMRKQVQQTSISSQEDLKRRIFSVFNASEEGRCIFNKSISNGLYPIVKSDLSIRRKDNQVGANEFLVVFKFLKPTEETLSNDIDDTITSTIMRRLSALNGVKIDKVGFDNTAEEKYVKIQISIN